MTVNDLLKKIESLLESGMTDRAIETIKLLIMQFRKEQQDGHTKSKSRSR